MIMPEENVITPEAGQVPTDGAPEPQNDEVVDTQKEDTVSGVSLTAEEYNALKALLAAQKNATEDTGAQDSQEEAPEEESLASSSDEETTDEEQAKDELTLEEHNQNLQKQVEELTSQLVQQKLTLTLYTHAERAGINPVAAMESTYVAGQLAKVDTADPKAVVKLLKDIVAERPYLAVAKTPKSSGVPHSTPGGTAIKQKARTLEEALGKYYSE